LRSAGYQPFIELVRASLGHAAGVRIDHVAGLFRLYWVPAGAGAAHGVYVRYPWADLCKIVALESSRAGAVVIGEDLGTVEDEARQALMEAGVLSYRLLWFERRPPSEWPEAALAAVTTHDLPTIAGVRTGADESDRRACGVAVDPAGDTQLEARLTEAAGVRADAPHGEVVLGAYRALAESPCLLVAATLEDALEVEERPNLPGTTVERSNWCLALPEPLEEIERDERVDGLAAVLREAREARAERGVRR
jgi:4-alpha-glucanotransferase